MTKDYWYVEISTFDNKGVTKIFKERFDTRQNALRHINSFKETPTRKIYSIQVIREMGFDI